MENTSYHVRGALRNEPCLTPIVAIESPSIYVAGIRSHPKHGASVSILVCRFACVGEVEGVVALKPLSLKRFALLDAPAVEKRALDGVVRVAMGHETDDDFELFALDVAGRSRLGNVLKSCGEREHLLDPRRLRPREGLSLSRYR